MRRGGLLARLRGIYDSAAAPDPVVPKPDEPKAKPKRARSPEPLVRPADVSLADWQEILAQPPCTLTMEQLRVNDKVFLAAVEAAAREVERTPPPKPWSPWPKNGPTQEELRAKEAAKC